MQVTNFRGMKIIALDGATLNLADGDGEVQATISLPVGPHDLSEYQPLLDVFHVTAGQIVRVGDAGRRLRAVGHDAPFQSGASALYTPSLAEQQEAQMRQMVQGMVKSQLAQERSRAKRAANAVPDPVLEDDTPPPAPPEADETPSGDPEAKGAGDAT